MARLPLGKLPTSLLDRVLSGFVSQDARVVIGPAVGEDAAVIDFGTGLLVAKSDPITFTSQEAAWYAVHVNANDVACMGARPRWFLATVLLPEECTVPTVERLFEDLKGALEEVGVELVGGHTEVTAGLDRPVIAGTMLGETTRERLVDNRRITVEDDLVLIKGLAIEATSILAREKATELREAFSEGWIDGARDFLRRPGISVLEPALQVLDTCHPHAMHDPTEGGLVGAIRELATLAGVGMRLYADHVHVYPETDALCAEFGLDPLGLLASGALLVVLAPEDTDVLLDAIRDHGTEAFVIGQVVPEEDGLTMVEGGEELPFPEFETDELARLLEEG